MKIDINGVSITLTPQQLQEINLQQSLITDWKNITSFGKAVEALGKNDLDVIEWKSMIMPKFQSKTINQKKLEICIKAVNQSWIPDWNNRTQYKWRNWFEFKSSVGWVFISTYAYSAYSYMGVDFYIESKEKAEHCAKYFINEYKSWLNNN